MSKSNVLRLSSCLLVAAALAACNKTEPAAPADAAQPPAATSAAPPAAASASQAATPPAADDTTPVALDMDKVKAYMQALKNLAAAGKADPSMGDPAQNLSEENSEQYTARLEASAKMRAAIAAAGLSTRDFVRIGDTFLGAMMAEGALEGGQLKTLPDGIDPASVEFVKQHKAELQALMNDHAG